MELFEGFLDGGAFLVQVFKAFLVQLDGVGCVKEPKPVEGFARGLLRAGNVVELLGFAGRMLAT